MDSTPREKKGRKLFPTPNWSCFKQREHHGGQQMTKQTFHRKKLFSSFLSPDTHQGLEENPPSKNSKDGEDVEDNDRTLIAEGELDFPFTVPVNNHSLSEDSCDITVIQTTSQESDLMTSDESSLKATECVSFKNLLSTISVDQSTKEMCKTFMVPGLSGELLANTTSTSSSSLAHHLENFKDYSNRKGNNLNSISNKKLDLNEPLDLSLKSNKAIDYLIKPPIKKKAMDTVLSENSKNGRYNLADESVPNTCGISKIDESLIPSGSCSKTFTLCYGDPKEQLPQDTSKGAIKKVNTKPKIDSHKDELFTSVPNTCGISKIDESLISSGSCSKTFTLCYGDPKEQLPQDTSKAKIDSKPVRDLTALNKIPIPKTSALGKVSRISQPANVQLRPRNPLQISNANVNQKSQPLCPTKPKIQFGSSGAQNLMIFNAKPNQEPFKRGGNVGFELGQNMAEGSHGNNTKRRSSAAKRRSDAISLAGKMPNRTRAGVLERQQGYANVVRTNKAHELIMQRRQLSSKISSPRH